MAVLHIMCFLTFSERGEKTPEPVKIWPPAKHFVKFPVYFYNLPQVHLNRTAHQGTLCLWSSSFPSLYAHKISKHQEAKPKHAQFKLLVYAILDTCSSSLVAAMYPTMLCISSCVPPLLRKYLISPQRDVRIVLRSSGAKSLSLQPFL